VSTPLPYQLTDTLRNLVESEGLPALPSASIMLMRNPHSQSPVTEKLAEYIGEGFRL
ncbi:LysR family transcriptional regulator, partial [Pseudomonas aeruginosa]